MNDTNKILIGVTGVTVLGVGIWLLTKKGDDDNTTNSNTTSSGGQMIDPSTSSIDSLGTTIGNLFQNIWGTTQNNNNNNNNTQKGCNYNGPADAYSHDGLDKDDYDSAEIKKMQTKLSGMNPDIKSIIDVTGGVDGIIGNGFKDAYNMARRTCRITGTQDLESQSNIA